MRVVVLLLESSQAPALRAAATLLARDHGVDPGLKIVHVPSLRSETDWAALAQEIAAADLVFGSMLFGESYVRPLEPVLAAATGAVCMIMSDPALIRQTRLGAFVLAPRPEPEQPQGVMGRLMSAFRPKGGHGEGRRQIALFRGLAKMLKYLPGKARDMHSYVTVHTCWASPSPENLRRMLCMLIERYVPAYHGKLPVQEPADFPEHAIIHPDVPQPFADLNTYRKWLAQRAKLQKRRADPKGIVGLLTLRTTALGGNTAHLAALVHALEARNLEVRLAYSPGLDARPTVEKFFLAQSRHERRTDIDLLVGTTGFGLVGGPAASRPEQARAALEVLDVAYLDLIPLTFQRVEDWQADERGLTPMALALNVSLPELDSAVEPLVYAGPDSGGERLIPLTEQIELAADRIARRVTLHRTPNAQKRLALVLFSFPPNLGNAGTAAYLDVFAGVHRLLHELKADGYIVDVPATPEDLRRLVVEGNAEQFGTSGNVAARLPLGEYRRLFPQYTAIEPFWGRAPGELLTDGQSFYILGVQLGNVFVGLQPGFGYERDPMRLLMAKDAAPHHGFAAFYTWLERVFGADAVLHVGTHGALEFMPGKQAGLSAACWPARLLGTLPNIYYYCVNNPSEGSIARRRGAATLVSYMVPPVQQAGLYKGLRLLKENIEIYRRRPHADLLDDVRVQAERLGIVCESAPDTDTELALLAHELLQIEQRLIPVGLHVLGRSPGSAELVDILALTAAFARPDPKLAPLPQLVARGMGHDYADLCVRLHTDSAAQQAWARVEAVVREAIRLFVEGAPERGMLAADQYLAREARIVPGTLLPLWNFLGDLRARLLDEREIAGLLTALRGGYVPPSPGNDVVRNPHVAPTGRNIHALDPFGIPSAAAQAAGTLLANELVDYYMQSSGTPPETVALVLWGTDNLKTEGEGVAQTLALLGARAVTDEVGRISDVELLPLAELGRPRIDVVLTVSGIFRDLLGHQVELLDRAVRLAASADEPPELNFVRKHALEQAAALQISPAEAATRVFSNAPGSYGANVNHLVESSTWESDDQLSAAFLARKSFAYDPQGRWNEARALMEQALATVDLTFQNIDGVELGISDVDHYYEYLGGVTKSVAKLRGSRPTVLVADAAEFAGPGASRLRTLEATVRLESRAKLLNPKWFEAMLAHGYEGVREIEARVANTFGWSATADAVDGIVYQQVAETFLLDEELRARMAQLNPHAATALAGRLLEANNRGFWQADDATLDALRAVYADLEDRLEGVTTR